MQQLFFKKKEGMIYLVVSADDLNVKCHGCGNVLPIDDSVFIFRTATKKHYEIFYFCSNCVKKRVEYVYSDLIIASIKDTIPDGAELYDVYYTPQLRGLNVSCINAVGLYSEDKDKDKTKIAGRESLDGVTIGAMPKEKKLLKNEKEVSVFLKNIKKSKLIERKEIKRIGVKK